MKSKEMSDAYLINSYIHGSEDSLAVLINRHQSRIFGFILSKVADRPLSEDIFQDTFVKVIRTIKKGGYREEGKFLSWVMRIAHNLVMDHYRRNKRLPVNRSQDDFDIFNFIQDDKLHIEDSLIKEQILEDIKGLIEALPEEQKKVLTMRLYRDMSFKEIAEITGVSINTALGRMRYALINIRKMADKQQLILTAI
ncbi:MAG: sigma-70 family RNA polymerase sigma factor [Lutibacter sp.]|jgi:RNA polymerase sigma-70 factor (ECF subfamily)|nr:sigma-70 family RNA polymerase sigma factor [Lutibacter sp.]